VSLSADGSTALVGGNECCGLNSGGAWSFSRSNGIWTQQALISGVDANGLLGTSVALSGDGATALVGEPSSGAGVLGNALVFTRSGGMWVFQTRLVGFDTIGVDNIQEGYSVALSADGNTALIGGPNDNGGIGAAWVFSRSNGVWTQQMKLTGTGSVGVAHLGWSVSLSGDGNTAILGGPTYNLSGTGGAAWVFVRSNGVWLQQGSPLIGTGALGNASQGYAVALSGDGNTAMIGGYTDNGLAGAAWVFTRSNGVWTQQGNKLSGTGAAGNAFQGIAVALTGDGNTALVGGSSDNSDVGAAWVFTRLNGAWTQQGLKLVGTGAVPPSFQGNSVALASSGTTAIIGGLTDNNVGAAWVFVNTTAHDFNGDGFSDIAWRDTSGDTAVWLMNGAQITQAGLMGQVPLSWSLVGQRDFDGIGKSEWLWRDSASGDVAIWLLNGLQVVGSAVITAVPMVWSVAGTVDFNGDRIGDILWRDTSGNVAIWLMTNDTSVQQAASLGNVPLNWNIAGTGDFNGDGMGDILWFDTNTGTVAVWLMNGVQVLQAGTLGQVPTSMSIIGTGDFNGDGKADILWRDSLGNIQVWLMNGLQALQIGNIGQVPANWVVAETGDFNGDGKSDILWRDTNTGTVAIWFMNALQISSTASVAAVTADWTIQGLNAD
jgi:hypothetical protein